MAFLKGLMWVVIVIVCCAIVAWIFREILRRIMPELIAKPMRQAPLTAAFGILVILIYVICAVFAPVLAPYGQAEVFDVINLPPGEDPRFWLGTDQICLLYTSDAADE